MPPITNRNSVATAQTSLRARRALGPARALARWSRGRVAPGHVLDGAAEQQGAQDARQDPGGEELGDVGLGEDAVDHHDRRRRDHDAERAAAGHDSRRQAVGVAEALHRRVRDLGERGRRRDGGAADPAEPGRGPHGGHGQAPAQVADERVGRPEQLLGHARARHEVAHQDEERHHRQGVVAARLVELRLRSSRTRPSSSSRACRRSRRCRRRPWRTRSGTRRNAIAIIRARPISPSIIAAPPPCRGGARRRTRSWRP